MRNAIRLLSKGLECPVGVAAVILTSALTYSACEARLDDNLCPAEQEPLRTTILLLDTSDMLTPKMHEELERLVGELTGTRSSERAEFAVAPAEALVVYELPQSVTRMKPVITVCNPGGDPKQRGVLNDLTEGKLIALRQWQYFLDAIEPLYTRTDSPPHSESPIIETLGVIVPRHVASQRTMPNNVKPVHLILFSDLLQHSDDLSHYGLYPSPAEVKSELRHLQTDLTGVQISLYRLERGSESRWQTTDHYYWWTKLIQEFNGTVIFQKSI